MLSYHVVVCDIMRREDLPTDLVTEMNILRSTMANSNPEEHLMMEHTQEEDA